MITALYAFFYLDQSKDSLQPWFHRVLYSKREKVDFTLTPSQLDLIIEAQQNHQSQEEKPVPLETEIEQEENTFSTIDKREILKQLTHSE